MSQRTYTVEILTPDSEMPGSAPLVIHKDNAPRFSSDSGLTQTQVCWIIGRVGQESVLMSHEEAAQLHRFLGKALKG